MKIDSYAPQIIETDFCVVGGGMAGVCAAVAAARHGTQVVLVQDRPMLGGNASSEIRIWICGAHGENMKESGLIEEIQLENTRFNPSMQYNVWDYILIHFVQQEPNIRLLLNTACSGVDMDPENPRKILAVKAWQSTTQKNFQIRAKLFADCSGDSVLRVSGAEFRKGRESRAEFNESYAPEVPDDKTMGNSIILQTRKTANHKPFEPLPWAHVFEAKGYHRWTNPRDNYWWVETGGEQDTIRDAEEIRDELLKMIYGIWSMEKNNLKAFQDFDVEWIGVLPGKRESIRYVGDHTLTQNDVEKQGKFDDIVAYGGWSMDDHNPAAFYSYDAPATVCHPAPSPYGIPYRCLYSKNVENLFFAGRNISATHMALSSTRVMATCSLLGQAVGTAAAIAVKNDLSPRGVYEEKIGELQETLMDDDSYLPWHSRKIPAMTKKAALTTENGDDAEVLRNGNDRTIGKESNCFESDFGAWIEYRFDKPTVIGEVRLTLDSDLLHANGKKMRCTYDDFAPDSELPETLLKEFSIQIQKVKEGDWQEVAYVEDNWKRLVRIPVDRKAIAIRLIPESSWGSGKARIYSFDVR